MTDLVQETFELNGGKTFIVITGASRGYGRIIAIEFSKNIGKDSLMVLVATNQEKLEMTKNAITRANASVKVVTVVQDLSLLNGEKALSLVKTSLGSEVTTTFDKTILIHNAGSLGSISKTVDQLDNTQQLQDYFNLNLHSVYMLTSAFLKTFLKYTGQRGKCLIINISSLAAISPFCGWAQYCSVKAAREMYFKVLAIEYPCIKVLNYSPGPMDTDMADQIIKEALPSVRDWFINARKDDTLVSCEGSVKKLLNIVKERTFESGMDSNFKP